jgi:ADP-glucose pyrophosphorylase
VLVLAGDHIYAMDYRPLLALHRDTGVDVTVACVQRSRREAAGRFGVLDLDERGRVIAFAEAHSTDKRHSVQRIVRINGILFSNRQPGGAASGP